MELVYSASERYNLGMQKIDWKEYIHSDLEVLVGKAVLKGTRLSVEFILGLFEQGWNEEQVLENYPRLTPEMIRAVFAYARECMEEVLYTPAPVKG